MNYNHNTKHYGNINSNKINRWWHVHWKFVTNVFMIQTVFDSVCKLRAACNLWPFYFMHLMIKISSYFRSKIKIKKTTVEGLLHQISSLPFSVYNQLGEHKGFKRNINLKLVKYSL